MNIVKGSDNCSDWNNFKIKDVFLANEKSKVKASDSFSEGLFPFFNCSEKQTKFSNDFLVDGENIFISTGGDFMYTLYHKGRASYSTDVWSVKVLHCDTKFIGYKLKSNFEQNQIHFRGFKFKHLNKNSFKESSITVPSLYQQRQIVEILSKQESIISKTKELINELDKRNTFMLDELLSGRLRIKDEYGAITFYKNPEDNWQSVMMNGEEKRIPKDWQIENIGEKNLYMIKTGLDKFNGERKYYATGDINIFKMNDSPTSIVSYENRTSRANLSVKENAVYFARMKDTLKVLRFRKSEDIILSTGFLGLMIDNDFDVDFVFYNIISDGFQNAKNENCNGATQKSLSDSSARKLSVMKPNIKEQKDIVKVLNNLYSEKEKYEQLLIEEQKKFDFLLEELMSGRLRIEE